jgi:hypothetical protein
MVEESGGSVGIRGGGAGRGGGMRQVGRPGMVPGRGGGGSELLGAGSLGGGGLGNNCASEATRVAAALAGKYLTAESDEAKSEADNVGKVGEEEENREVTLLRRMMSGASLAKQQRLEKGRAAEELNKDEDWVPREARAWPVSEAVRLDNELQKTAGMSPQVSVILKNLGTGSGGLCCLFSQFTDAQVSVILKNLGTGSGGLCCLFSQFTDAQVKSTLGAWLGRHVGRAFSVTDTFRPSMSAPETNMILGATWNIRAQLVIEAAEDLRNDGRTTYVSRELDQSGQVVKEGESGSCRKERRGCYWLLRNNSGKRQK